MPLDDELLERYGVYYSSEYVEINQPWIREITFEEWVERQLKLRMKRFESLETYKLDLVELPYESPLPETA